MHVKRIVIFFLLATVFATCRPLTKVANLNMAHLYNQELKHLSPQYQITHINGTISTLNISITSADLFYVREGQEGFLIAHFKVSCLLFTSFESKSLIDSVTVTFTDTLPAVEPYRLERNISFSPPAGSSGILFIEFEDLKRRAQDSYFTIFDKSNARAADFFTIKARRERAHTSPFFVPVGQETSIEYADTLNFRMEVNHYPHISYIPVPPYVTAEIPDSLLPLAQESSNTLVVFEKGKTNFRFEAPGIYHFHEPGNKAHGFIVLCVHQSYPKIMHPDQMLHPLRYITARDEFDNLFSVGDSRLAVNRFWTRSAGNPDRARELIKKYYSRVEESNRLFSSFIQGWQTDRGMIYIIFGPPQMVYRTDAQETWHYAEGMNIPAAQFVFNKHNNVFSHNHFMMVRNQGYRSNWNHAVNIWRR